MRAALQNLLLRRILATSATSNLADGLFLLGLPIVAAQTGASPLWIGLLSAAQTVWWLFSIPLSTLIDRLGPGPLLLIVRPIRIVVAVVAMVIVAFPPEQQLFFLLVIAAMWGFLEVLADSAVMALPALLLGEQTYDESYALLYSTQSVTNTILGSALGAFLIMVNTWLVFVVAAILLGISFIIQHPLLRRSEVQPVQSDTSDTTSLWNDVTDGWNHIRKDRFLRAMMITLAGIVVAEEVVATVVVP
ncbi:MAG: hypothetical protein GFH27_549379n23 [Chloroflexi bacterium AL-W]|nr:hypothetical protein [Chloroflexi bacterium AL-N1]NOK71147.1 hypothetical protein [Chloroflexi bacterium AL-N10]NOK78613.1 hypothetical protein [Chloroflexi bacterium AL-N5]NOK85909.1 hypothetical protein [Chloroflexi bacterium AL-W]NOK92884.1 hypothetical protein [Chloroflexi bacterium AL-N15]